MTKNSLTKIARWFERLVGYQPRFNTIMCDDLPDVCEANNLYIVGENNTYWMAALVCPCGCGDLIQLALDQTGRPRWQVFVNKRLEATLRPSVHRKVGCRSHFVFRDGRIIWCHDRVLL